MGTYSHELLDINGQSGHTYSLRRMNTEAFSMEDLDDVRFYAIWRGRIAVGGGLEPRTTGNVGLIKIKPEFSSDEIQEIKEAGFSVGIDPAHEHVI